MQPAPGFDHPPSYYPPNWDDVKRGEFDKTVRQLDIQDWYLAELRQALVGSKKVVVVDNSGSMGQGLRNTHLNRAQYPSGLVRRMDELISFITIAVPLLALDSPDGVDFWFLNNPDGSPGPVLVPNVQTFEQVRPQLMYPPNGRTPLVVTMQRITEKYAQIIPEQGIHCIIATDGAPSEGPDRLYDLILRRAYPRNYICNFLVCTDEDSEVEYLNYLDNDKRTVAVDVTDDYDSERTQVLKAGKLKRFTYHDWIIKAVVGASSPKIDEMDEAIRVPNLCSVL